MDPDNDSGQSAEWKKKYFEQLELYERQEKEWRELDQLLRKAVSRLALAADGLDKALDEQLRDLRAAVRDQEDTARLRSCIDRMSRTLVRLDQRQGEEKRKATTPADDRPGLLRRLFGGSGTDRPEAQASGDATDHIREILIRLLERLSLPDDLSPAPSAVRERIEAVRSGDSWDGVLEQISDLVQAIRSRTQKEKRGIEDFLVQLTERLQEVDRQLQGSEKYYDDSHASGGELGSAVKKEMDDIGDSMRRATDLQQLKQVVESRINSVLERMDRFREAEQRRYDEAKQQIATMKERLRGLEGEADQLRSQVSEERSQAVTDPLTGIPNRLAWEERLEQELVRYRRFGMPLVLMVWDIDHFKQINDRFGHKAGDRVLRTIARTLAGGVRQTDFVARYGGEEFVQLMVGSSLDDCLMAANKLREKIEQTGFHFRDQAVTITTSCGLAELGGEESAGEWFERADKALYRAKKAGRNRCEAAR
ncbi:MAG TPA: GGDEF domain-containing protein [Gammaproteobacteria bacterium]|nr:GGDEF domain-containing protein [Gammaproteobacteria bacterium]